MAICRNCGKNIEVVSTICPNCHTAITSDTIINKETLKQVKNDYDAKSNMLMMMGVFLPLVGFIYYFIKRDESKLKATSALGGSLIGVVVILFFVTIWMLLKIF